MQKVTHTVLLSFFIFLSINAFSQAVVNIDIDAASDRRPVSPYIYGKNNSLSDNPGKPLSATEWKRLRDAGIRIFRENGGNNSTKYNWRRKLSSHPDWYNNVFPHDWGFAAGSLQENIPSAQGMWAFQLIGKAAESGAHNFNSWDFNEAQGWDGVRQNLCGGGQVNEAGGEYALVDGDPDLYLEDWPADSTVGILDEWFGDEGIGLDSNGIFYWNMDNEPEIWQGTHDDVWPAQPDADTFMQMYFAVAKKAREKFPGIKLLGPVPANEWQWYIYKGSWVYHKDRYYPWLEYFILRIAEEQQASGVRLLDVLDIHFYPGETSAGDIVQLHRVYFDTTYNYPGANGVKRTASGDWNNSQTREYILERCRRWLEKYMGPDHGVTLGVTETGINSENPNVIANWYASTLGEFAKEGVEIFTPWSWENGMFEVLHLFSTYGKGYYIDGVSSDEKFVSAYPTINDERDSMTVFLVNRHLEESMELKIQLEDFPVRTDGNRLYSLSGLPQNETFSSHEDNSLSETQVEVSGDTISLILPPLSVHALILYLDTTSLERPGVLVAEAEAENGTLSGVTIDSLHPGYSGAGYVTGFNESGDQVSVNVEIPRKGFYRLLIWYNAPSGTKTQDLIIGSNIRSPLSFPATDTFSFVDAGSYLLDEGTGTFTIRQNGGGVNIDKFQIISSGKNEYDISPELVDPLAADETKALYEFLKLQFGDRIISGQTHDYYNQLKTLTSKSPLLRVHDFQHFTEGYPYLWVDGAHSFGKHDDGSVDALTAWYNSTDKKGIISYQWHWHSPSGGEVSTNTFYTDLTTFDVTKAVTPGTQEYEDIIRDIDDVSAQLKKFQDSGIPVLWRPLHEAGGGWFWWGAKGPEACLELYNIMFDRMTNHHQLHNLIWVWSSPEEDWYPGNDKVDIIGYDSYPGALNYSTRKSVFDALYRLTGGKKLIAMTENGPIPDPDDCLELDAPWLYFMSWNNLVFEQNTDKHILEVYDNPDVLTVESKNFKTDNEWRSTLYPENWKPGYRDGQGRFLHDFSYAGYHKGETEPPHITTNVVDITTEPYNADPGGVDDVTAIIQQALDDVGSAGGGVVYLPAGTYRIKTPAGADYGLHIRYDSTVLRGAGPDSTFLFHDETYMRQKDIIHIRSEWSNWFTTYGSITNITADLLEPTRFLPVGSVSGFSAGDHVIVSSQATDAFIEEHKMAGIWTADAIQGVAFMRKIDSVDAERKLLIIDAPTRYFLKTRDNPRVYHAKKHISECGIENLSLGNREHPGTGWDEESYSSEGTGAWDVHFSHAIQFKYARDCWVKNVATFKPAVNTGDIHVLSNCLLMNYCRNITVDSCFFQKSQYEGGGGNGYMFTLSSNDCLIKNSRANHSRHNYDFKYPFSNGNVIHNCRAENSKYSSDFHMYLSMANLFDACTVNGDYLESTFRPYGGSAIHGYSSTQSVFYNTTGEAYHPERDYLIESLQFRWGYIIGTSGAADQVMIDPMIGTAGGYSYDTSPRDFTEGIGEGEGLRPWSLYLDQFHRRLMDSVPLDNYSLEIVVRDKHSGEPVQGAELRVYADTVHSDESGLALFTEVPGSVILSIDKIYYKPLDNKQIVIDSDTSLTVYITKNEVDVMVTVLEANNAKPIWGADITFGSVTRATDFYGNVGFTLFQGYHEYSLDENYFRSDTGLIYITSDTSVQFYMTRTEADVKFLLKDGTASVNNATVILGEDTLVTVSLGMAFFRQVPVPENYHFLIRKSGYDDQEGTIFITTDTTIYVAMEAWPDNTDSYTDDEGYSFWPNPVTDLLQCRLSDPDTEKTLRIMDATGREFYSHTHNNEYISINVRDYPPGIYLLEISSKDRRSTRLFIKE